MTTLIGLHGFAQSGAQLRNHMSELLGRLPPALKLVFPDGPHPCSEAGLERLQRNLGGAKLPPPHLAWWDATDDGGVYRGWEASREQVRALVEQDARVGLLGFSQGAILAGTIAALSARGAFPPLAFVVLIAGAKPRAAELRALFDRPLALPSLHIWGERDVFAKQHGDRLLDQFEPAQREVVTWPGPHVVPTRGPGGDALADFLSRQLTA